MITAVAVCPHPPLLVPEIAGGAAKETDDLRAACDAAVARLLVTEPQQIVVVGAESAPTALRGYAPGVTGLGPDDLPLSLAVGAWLLDRAALRERPALPDRAALGERPAAVPPRRLVAVRPDGTPTSDWPDLSASTGLLIMADGSARRGVKAPGYLDERAEPFDAIITKALAEADVGVLANLDVDLCQQLLIGGVGAFRALAGVAGSADGRWRAEVLYDAAPYGVQYTVACWLPA
jgi:hypothetical protein